MPSKDQMRYLIKQVYAGSQRWSDKVDRMSDSQVLAIYTKFKRNKKI